MAKQFRVAVCGATGAVGNQMIQCLEERQFPISELRLIASERSRGRELKYKGQDIPVRVLGEGAFDGIDIALFSAGASTSLAWAPKAWGAVSISPPAVASWSRRRIVSWYQVSRR